MIVTSLVYEHRFCSFVLMQMLSPVISTRACVGRGRVCLFSNTASIACHTSQTLDDKKKGFEWFYWQYVWVSSHVCICRQAHLLHRGLPLDFYQFPLQLNTNLQENFQRKTTNSMSNPCQTPIKTFKTIITWCQLCQHFLYEHALRIQAGLAKDCKHFISLYSVNRSSLKASINPNLQQLSTFFIVTLSTVKRIGLYLGTSYSCISIQKHTKNTLKETYIKGF